VIHLWPVLMLVGVLAGTGLYGVLARRNAVLVLIGVELLLNAGTLLLVTADTMFADQLHSGQVLTVFVITLAAAEVGVALAVILLLFRTHGSVDLRAASGLGEATKDLAAQAVADSPPVTDLHAQSAEAAR
jgi:NADH-quinone oxidoreductase subunit K